MEWICFFLIIYDVRISIYCSVVVVFVQQVLKKHLFVLLLLQMKGFPEFKHTLYM